MARNTKNLAPGETLDGADDEPTEQNTDPNQPVPPAAPVMGPATDPVPEEAEDRPAVLPPKRRLDRTQPFAEVRGPNGLAAYEQRGALYDLQDNRKAG